MKTQLLSLFLLSTTFLFAQNTHYPTLDGYKRTGWMLKGAYFKAGHSSIRSGTAKPEHLPILSYGFGFNYHIHANQKWSFSSGIWTIREAAYHVKFNYIDDKEKVYAIHSFSFPLLAHYQLPVFKNTFLHTTMGLKSRFLPPGGIGLGYSSDSINLFDSNSDSPNNFWQGGFLIGGGASWARKKFLLRADLLYTYNFQNTLEGNYKFENLPSTPDSEGSYSLSGNHWALMLSLHLPSKKHKAITNTQDEKNSRPKRYQKLGWMISPVLYNKAKSTLTSGTKVPQHQAIRSYNIGFNYDFLKRKKWLFSTGLWASLEPNFKSRLNFDENDFKRTDTNAFLNSETKFINFSTHSYSLPLLARYQIPLSQHSSYYPIMGVKAKFLLQDRREYYVSANDNDYYYKISRKSPKNSLQASILLGAGVSIKRKKYLIRTDLIYNINTQNSLEGWYEYRNLLVTPDSDGSYVLSGNYWALMLTIHLPSKKKI